MIVKEPSDYLAPLTQKIKTNPKYKMFAYQTWYRYMFDYIPYRTGALASTYHINNNGIHFTVPYAAYQYFGDGFNFSKEMHPLAQAHWGQAALDYHGAAIADEIKEFIIRSE